jgi:hypothetical protein
VDGLLGAKLPDVFDDGWRVFYTAQHGMNMTFEVLPADDGKPEHERHHWFDGD